MGVVLSRTTGVVLSRTTGVVLSGTEESSYREPESGPSHGFSSWNPALNLANIESFGFFLTLQARGRSVNGLRAGWRHGRLPGRPILRLRLAGPCARCGRIGIHR